MSISVASVYELRNLFIKGSTGLAHQSSVEPVNKPPKRAVKFKKKTVLNLQKKAIYYLNPFKLLTVIHRRYCISSQCLTEMTWPMTRTTAQVSSLLVSLLQWQNYIHINIYVLFFCNPADKRFFHNELKIKKHSQWDTIQQLIFRINPRC